MTKVVDDLTSVHLDAAADDPSQARAELLALLQKVQELITLVNCLDSDANATAITIDANEDVGIGVAPVTGRRLSVKDTGTNHLRIASSGANTLDRGIEFTNATDTAVGYVTVTPNTAGTDTLMSFYVGGGGGGDVKLHIHDDGGIYTTNATGGSQGADTFNASGLYIDGVDLDAGAVTNWVRGHTVYVKDDTGASSNVFDLYAAMAGGVWESIGPTGSGATNIWTALDDVVSGAKWVELLIKNQSNDTTQLSSQIHLRKGGDTTAAGDETLKSYNYMDVPGETGLVVLGTMTSAKVPVDASGIFEAYRSFSLGSSGFDQKLILSSFGY